MTKSQNMVKGTAKVATVTTSNFPKNPEIGELFYDVTTNRLYIWTVAGWKYAGFT